MVMLKSSPSMYASEKSSLVKITEFPLTAETTISAEAEITLSPGESAVSESGAAEAWRGTDKEIKNTNRITIMSLFFLLKPPRRVFGNK